MGNRIAVIGGGASGMTAAIRAAQLGAAVTIYERNERIGKKILATGNGRCNLTNLYADVKHYHGEYPDFIRYAKSRFWVQETLEFFKSLGLLHRVEEEGRVYPCSGQASAVLDLLRIRLERLGVRIETGFEAEHIIPYKKGFRISSYDGRMESADAVILSAGGKAAPSMGTTGSGYELAKELGHSITPLYPSLVQIKTEEVWVRSMKGIKTDAAVRIAGKEKRGEVLFTEYGFSGPPVFSLSAELPGTKYNELVLDLLPDYSPYKLKKLLLARRELGLTLEYFLVGMVHKRIGMQLMKCLEFGPLAAQSDSLSDVDIERLAQIMKNWRFHIAGTMSWNNAQVTAGGIRTAQIDERTMQSKLVKGLFITGEIMDIDGDCGGYNLQWAWSTGMIAAEEAVRLLKVR